MFLRSDRLQAELRPPRRADPNQAVAFQALLGGKYGEMSTLGNCPGLFATTAASSASR